MAAPALSIPGLPSPCSLPGISDFCHAVGSAGKAVANDVLGTVAKAFASAAQHTITLAMSFWTNVPLPTWDANSGPVGQLQHATAWVTGAVAVGCLLVGAGRLALARNTMPAHDLLRGILTLVVVSALCVPVVNYLGQFCDGFATWIIQRAGDTGGRIGAIGAGFAALDAPVALLLAFFAMLASLVQVALMVVRVGIIAILTGMLPMFAAASSTKMGDQSFKRACGWLLAALLYSPTAAIIYASALWLTNTGTDVISVISGLAMMVLAVLAMPALLRLVQPLTSPAVHSGGGGVMAGAGIALATGARMAASSSSGDSSSRSPASGPSGAIGPSGPGSNGHAPSAAAGSNGASGGANGAAGGAAAAGGNGASAGTPAAGAGAAAGGPAGVAVIGVTEGLKAAKGVANSSVPSGGNGHHDAGVST